MLMRIYNFNPKQFTLSSQTLYSIVMFITDKIGIHIRDNKHAISIEYYLNVFQKWLYTRILNYMLVGIKYPNNTIKAKSLDLYCNMDNFYNIPKELNLLKYPPYSYKEVEDIIFPCVLSDASQFYKWFLNSIKILKANEINLMYVTQSDRKILSKALKNCNTKDLSDDVLTEYGYYTNANIKKFRTWIRSYC